ncbi:MAG: DUF3179 domain-containing (seleno)protein [Pseudomonadota bacterium]|nr:DUF3179 domain-containing (seleno)protein [Pseudomonadota bacterium]MEC9216392.1 DUF3179 domain-containing (seleno)protein [Pseudomonadota bacterium]
MKARALPLMAVVLWATTALAAPAEWRGEWPNTDFSRHSVDYAEIISGGPPRDGIPAIDAPRFKALDAVDLADSAPVIGLTVNGDSRAYPLGILTWHEIANDTVGEVPVAVTYFPPLKPSLRRWGAVNRGDGDGDERRDGRRQTRWR